MDYLFAAHFQSRSALLKSRLNIHDAKLAVLHLPMSSHGPHKSDAMSRHRDIRMISSGRKYSVAVSHYGYHFRIIRVVINKLYAVSRFWHVKVNVHLFQHFCVFLRWPARPIARIGVRKSGHETPRLHILSDQHAQLTGRTLSTSAELQPPVLRSFCVTYQLKRVLAFHIRGKLRQIDFALCPYVNRGVPRDVNRVVLTDLELLPGGFHVITSG